MEQISISDEIFKTKLAPLTDRVWVAEAFGKAVWTATVCSATDAPGGGGVNQCNCPSPTRGFRGEQTWCNNDVRKMVVVALRSALRCVPLACSEQVRPPFYQLDAPHGASHLHQVAEVNP